MFKTWKSNLNEATWATAWAPESLPKDQSSCSQEWTPQSNDKKRTSIEVSKNSSSSTHRGRILSRSSARSSSGSRSGIHTSQRRPCWRLRSSQNSTGTKTCHNRRMRPPGAQALVFTILSGFCNDKNKFILRWTSSWITSRSWSSAPSVPLRQTQSFHKSRAVGSSIPLWWKTRTLWKQSSNCLTWDHSIQTTTSARTTSTTRTGN